MDNIAAMGQLRCRYIVYRPQKHVSCPPCVKIKQSHNNYILVVKSLVNKIVEAEKRAAAEESG